jgi:hypothetical protein
MVLGQHRQPLVGGVERRPFGDGEAEQRATDLQPQVVVAIRRVVQVDDEAAVARFANAVLAFRCERLVRSQRIAFLPVFVERVFRRLTGFRRLLSGCDALLLAFTVSPRNSSWQPAP